MLMLTLEPAWVFAHNLSVDCRLADAVVHVEVYYDDDTPGANAKVEVRDANEKVIVKGVTDNQGKWSCAAPPPGKYVVYADAGAGHRAKRRINVPAPAEQARGAENSPTPDKSAMPSIRSDSISEGPSKDEITRTPWLKIAIGLAVIGVCSGAFVVAMRLKRGAQAPR